MSEVEIYSARKVYQNENIARFYDKRRFSSLLGKFRGYLEKKAILKALKGIPRNSKILDVACGTGRITKILLDAGYKVTGVDISEAMLEQIKDEIKLNPNMEGFYTMDIEHIKFEENRFDISIAIRLLGHLPNRVRKNLLEELKRVTKKYLILMYFVNNPITILRHRMVKMFKKNENPFWYPLTYREISEEITGAGLKIEKIVAVALFFEQATIYLIKKDFKDE